jgi:dihydroflavonol-4-reductase
MGNRQDAASTGAPGPLSVVTGGAGFIGRHLVQLLLDRGHRVRVVDICDTPPVDPRVEMHKGSILDRMHLQHAFVGADYVFHLAANPNLWAADKRTFDEVNHEGTRRVLEAADEARARRIVYCSTESILKGIRDDDRRPADEAVARSVDDMPGPYCRSKFLAERAAFEAAARGQPVVIVNPTLPVGPGDHRITPPTRMLLDFLNGENPAYLDFDMNVIDVRDAALGHLLAAERGAIGARYILGGENVRLSQVLGILHELTGLRMPTARISYPLALAVAAVSETIADRITRRPPKASLTGVRLAGTSMTFDNSRARRDLTLEPRPARWAIAAAVAWLQADGRVHRSLPREPRLALHALDTA